MMLLERMSIRELKNAVWQDKNGMVPVGGLPREWYEDELEKRTGTRRGYHETELQIKEGAGITPKAVDLIYRLSGLTHANIVSKVSCVYYVYIGIAVLLFGEQRGIQWCIKQEVEDVEEFFSDNEPQYVLNYTGMESLKDSLDLEEHDIKSTGFVVDSLEASLWCLYTTSSYKEAVLRAVNLGGDTDTIGAITGSLAGLYYGYEEIPKEWVKDLKNKKLINSICDRFYEQYK